MNFFEHQRYARRRSAIYLLLFAVATVVVVAVTNAVVLGTFYVLDHTSLTFWPWLHRHPSILGWTTLAVLAVVGGASGFRITQLAGGGGRVARELGGKYVGSSIDDPQCRQLLNVVQEMALAAGITVPSVYVLENENGINAFAVGFGTADAAIAVTRGALVRLDRDELQGVIGHELSHILNGDTRLNTQLIGVLFGIMAIALIGRLTLRALRESDDVRGALVAIVPGLVLMTIGYVGLFCGRMIQAAISRSRESLADACAAQFTRYPAGLAGALKKIAVAPGQGILLTECDQVSHMLIVDGRKLFDQFFATHPPLLDRIKALDPHFDINELERIKLRPVPVQPVPRTAAAKSAFTALSPAAVAASVGSPTDAQFNVAAQIQAAIPEALRGIANSRVHAPALVFALALNKESTERTRQIARLHERVPATLLAHFDAVASMTVSLPPELRMPLIALAFPALRERSGSELQTLAAGIEEIERMDGRFDFLDYALLRWLRVQLGEAAKPARAPGPAGAKLISLSAEAAVVFSLLAQAGDRDKLLARRAYEAGMNQLLGVNAPAYVPPDPWVLPLDRALTRLDTAAPIAKQSLIEALVLTVMHDRRVTLAELELLRAICASLHCPLPPLNVPTAENRPSAIDQSHAAAR